MGALEFCVFFGSQQCCQFCPWLIIYLADVCPRAERNAAQGLASLLAAIQATYRSAAEALMGV